MATSNAPAPPNPELVIRKIGDEKITIFSVPFKRLGIIPFGGRSTAIRLSDSSVWLVASHPLCDKTLTTLTSIGPVKHVIAIDREHTMYTTQYAAAFPEAAVYLPDGTYSSWSKDPSKKPYMDRVKHVFGQGKPDPFPALTNGEIESVDFGKAFVNEDIAFLHKPTKTMIEADLLLNTPCNEQYSQSSKKGSNWLSNGMAPGTMKHQRMLWYLTSKDRDGMSKAAKLVSAWDFERIIPCHGDVIEQGGKQAWDSTYAWFLNGKK